MKTAHVAMILGLLVLTIPLSEAAGFDGHRAGFVLGLGAGYASVFKVSTGGPDLDAQGLLTDVVVGHGVSDQLLVHYSGRQVWAKHDGLLYTAVFPSVAVTYFLRPQSSSFYLTGSLGLGGAGDLTIEGGNGGASGLAGFAGVGFEAARHLQLEAVGGVLSAENNYTYGTVGVSLKAIAY